MEHDNTDGDGVPVAEYVALYSTLSQAFLQGLRERAMVASTNTLYSTGIPKTPTEVAQLCQLAFSSAVLFAVLKGFVTLNESALKDLTAQPAPSAPVASVGNYL